MNRAIHTAIDKDDDEDDDDDDDDEWISADLFFSYVIWILNLTPAYKIYYSAYMIKCYNSFGFMKLALVYETSWWVECMQSDVSFSSFH